MKKLVFTAVIMSVFMISGCQRSDYPLVNASNSEVTLATLKKAKVVKFLASSTQGTHINANKKEKSV